LTDDCGEWEAWFASGSGLCHKNTVCWGDGPRLN
jgi:hypothetical protein